METFVKDEDAIRNIVQKFENCQFSPEQFTHAHHLTVASWYLCTMDPASAQHCMRAGLQRFIAHHGKQGYHETITRFWMELLAGYLDELPDSMPLLAKVNRAVEDYRNKEIVFTYYTRERVMADAARQNWIDPDLQPIRKAPLASSIGNAQPLRD